MLIEAWLQIPVLLCPEGGLINLTPHIQVFSWRAVSKIEIHIVAQEDNYT